MNPAITRWINSCRTIEQLQTCMNLIDLVPTADEAVQIINLISKRFAELYPDEKIIIKQFKLAA